MQANFSDLKGLLKKLYSDNDNSPKTVDEIDQLKQVFSGQASALENELPKYGNPTLTKNVEDCTSKYQQDISKASHIAFNKEGSQSEMLDLLDQAQMNLNLALSDVERA